MNAVSPSATACNSTCAGIEKPNVPGTPLALFAFATNVRERTETGTSESTWIAPASIPNGAAPPNVVPTTSSIASVFPAPTTTATGVLPELSPSAEEVPSIGDCGRNVRLTCASTAFGFTMRSELTNASPPAPVAFAVARTHWRVAGESA